MSYRDFKFPDVLSQLRLGFGTALLFTDVFGVALRPDVMEQLREAIPLVTRTDTEKSRSEFLVAPILFEVWRMTGKSFGLFSGVTFNVEPEKGLKGVCDFLLTRDPKAIIVQSPIMAVVEAKNDKTRNGFGQCIASMAAADQFNSEHGVVEPMYGVVTTGLAWRFLKIDHDRSISTDVVTLDDAEYLLLQDVDKIAGILLSIVAPHKGTL